MGKPQRNIINRNDGFNIMVNMYIIRYLYSHMKKFMAENILSQDFYDNIIVFSRPRFQRMCNGENFEISKEDKKHLSELFNIDGTYFTARGEIINVKNIDELDWKCFFNHHYYTDYDILENGLIFSDKMISKHVDKVNTSLKNNVKKGFIENNYGTDSALYRIYRYYVDGKTYAAESLLTRFVKELACLKISDWDEILENETLLKKYGDLLEKHYRYIQAVRTCIEYKK